MSDKCKLCGFAIGDKVHMRSANMPGRILRGEIEAWQASCGHLAKWNEISSKDNRGYEPFAMPNGNPIMATPTYSPEMHEKNTNVVLVTETLPKAFLS